MTGAKTLAIRFALSLGCIHGDGPESKQDQQESLNQEDVGEEVLTSLLGVLKEVEHIPHYHWPLNGALQTEGCMNGGCLVKMALTVHFGVVECYAHMMDGCCSN